MTLNLYLLLGFVLVALAAYYAVPLGVLLALWSVDGSMWGDREVRHRRWWAAAWILVVGSASAYYAAYTLVLVAGLGVAVAIRRRSVRELVVPTAVAAAIGGVVVANVAGDLLAARVAGTNIEASGRAASDLSLYALRPLRARPSPLGPYLAGVALVAVAVAVVDQTGALPARADAVRGMPMYSNLGPWAVGDGTVSYSSGVMQGRGGDWQSSWVAREPEVMVMGLAAAGFDVLYVDRRADPTPFMQRTPRSGAETADALAAAGLTSKRSSDGTREWFDLGPLREQMVDERGEEAVDALGEAVVRPIGVTFRGAAPYVSDHPGARLLDAESVITLRREDSDTRTVEVSFLLSGEPGATVEVSTLAGARQVVLGDAPTAVSLQVPMKERETTIRLDTDAAPLERRSVSSAAPRLRITNLEVATPGAPAVLP